jgi:hypothetical protein
MRRLAVDRELRKQLGRAARRHWEAEHSFERVVRDYERAMSRAAQLPDPTGERPAHLRPTSLVQARGLSSAFGAETAAIINDLESSRDAHHAQR